METTAGESATTLMSPNVKLSDIHENVAPVATTPEPTPVPEVVEGEAPKVEAEAPPEAEETIEVEGERIKKKGGFQRKIERQEREISELRAENARRDAMLEKALAAIEKTAGTKQEEQIKSENSPPSRDDFDDYQDFLEARTEWKTKETIRAEMTKNAEERQQLQKQEEQQQIQKSVEQQLEERKTKGREKYKDFQEVALADDVPISPLMAEVIAGSDNGEDMAYFLGKNRDEALRIARLSPLAAAKELGALEASLKAKPVVAPKTTTAPAPATPVSGSSGSAIQDLASLDMDAYMAKRKGEGAAWARR
jgi:hypothetical protein